MENKKVRELKRNYQIQKKRDKLIKVIENY
jgi:hypothetical protein